MLFAHGRYGLKGKTEQLQLCGKIDKLAHRWPEYDAHLSVFDSITKGLHWFCKGPMLDLDKPKLFQSESFGSRGIKLAGWLSDWVRDFSPWASSAMEVAKETKFGTEVA